MSTRENLKSWLLVCAVSLVTAHQAFGQATTGTICGTVQDVQGSTVAGASITVRKLDTNLKRSQVTESDGRFRFPGLAIGPYELSVEQAGFAKYARGPILLLLNQDAVVNPVLEVAAATETITVREDAPLLNTTSPEVGVRFDERRLTDLPTLPPPGGGGFRDVFAFVLAAPGVSQLNSGNQVFATGPRVLNELRISWQRLANVTSATDPNSETIPSIEIPELGLTGFAASASRTAIGLAVNLPNSRWNNTYQLQETIQSRTSSPQSDETCL